MQKIVREHPSFWSQPDEYDIIWNRLCHPSLRNWHSDMMRAEDLQPGDAQEIHDLFEKYSCSSSIWAMIDFEFGRWSLGSILRSRWLRGISRVLYQQFIPVFRCFSGPGSGKHRLVNKSVHHCFRLPYLLKVFPDAQFIYITREGPNNVNSLINGWKNPTKNFTYEPPVELNIKGYDDHLRWNFTLPPGWMEYVNRPLEEVCAFQWIASHEAVMECINKPSFSRNVLRIRLEDLSRNPRKILRQLSDFLVVPFGTHFQELAEHFPIVNPTKRKSTDTGSDKWKRENWGAVERILPMIDPMMKRLGYHSSLK
jgi:hypothetical protein